MSTMAVATTTSSPLARMRSGARSVVLGLLSLVVLSGLVGYFVGPTQEALAATVTATRISSVRDVVYGTVKDEKGRPESDFRVVAYHFRHGHLVIDRITKTNKKGVYRVDIPGRSGVEYLQVNNRSNGSRKHVKFNIRPGHAYRVAAHYTRTSFFFVLPIFSY